MLLLAESVPTGHESDEAQAYYEWIWSSYLRRIPVPSTDILWSGPFWIALFALLLIGFFFLYAWNFQRTHRHRGELYGVASFAGSILERMGSVSWFNRIVWAVVILWAAYFLIRHILYGQTY